MWNRFASYRVVVVILLVAAAVRLYGLGWGLPFAYEEAQPLKKAWGMWGWAPDESFDPNPHFFNYPSLTIYTQFGGQAAMYAAMRTTGRAGSTEEFRVRYHTDPSPFYVFGRLIGVFFGLLTVFLVYRIGRRVGGGAFAVLAAFLLAINLFHVTRSQMVEVDVPLTCFVALAMLIILRLSESPSRRTYIFAGAAIGLATATKYTGAMLLVPLLAAHFLAYRATRGGDSTTDAASWPRPTAWWWALVSAAVSVVVFLAASPYVALDFPAFKADFAGESVHMRVGHFGVDAQAGWRFYATSLARLTGWPAVILAITGWIVATAVRRGRWSFVVSSFVVPYFVAISSWEMMADRYALPLLPFVLLYAAFASQFIMGFLPQRRPLRAAAWVVTILVLAAPIARSFPQHLHRYETDSRTLCLQWLEENVPPGSFVVSEAYGPPLAGPVEYWQTPGDLRQRLNEFIKSRSFYSFFSIPLFSVDPEETEAFYDIRLYRPADVLITTSAVRSRYSRDPVRYPRQVAFYDSIRTCFEEVLAIPASGTGPAITVYRFGERRPRFSDRQAMPPRRLRPTMSIPPYWHGAYYYRMAVNYEAFGHLQQAIAGYEMGVPFALGDSEIYREITYGMVRCLSMSGETGRASAFIEQMKARAPTQSDLDFVEKLEKSAQGYDRDD